MPKTKYLFIISFMYLPLTASQTNTTSLLDTNTKVFVVTSNQDNTAKGTLREAFNKINSEEATEVVFKLSEGDTIKLEKHLPILTKPFKIDGSNKDGSGRSIFIVGGPKAVAGIFLTEQNKTENSVSNLTFGNTQQTGSSTGVLVVNETGSILYKDAGNTNNCRNISLLQIMARVSAAVSISTPNGTVKNCALSGRDCAIYVEEGGSVTVEGNTYNGKTKLVAVE